MDAAELIALSEKATKGPWSVTDEDCSYLGYSWIRYGDDTRDTRDTLRHIDAALVVALRNLAPLLGELWRAAEAWKRCDFSTPTDCEHAAALDHAVAALRTAGETKP